MNGQDTRQQTRPWSISLEFLLLQKAKGLSFLSSNLSQSTQVLFFFMYFSIRLGLVISEHFTLVQFMDFFICQKE
jgi:uncharacterized protein YhaN